MGIKILRCDDRLIHGQCIVRILNDYQIDHIILVDSFTATNPVMKQIYKMAVPQSIAIDTLAPADAVSVIEAAAAADDNTLVLVKDPIVALELVKATDALPRELNIGPMSNRLETSKKTFYSYLLPGEEAACDGLTDLGVRVYFQQVPGEKEIEWAEVR